MYVVQRKAQGTRSLISVRSLRSTLLHFLLLIILFGCSFVPEQEQFISSSVGSQPSRSIGQCNESILRGEANPTRNLNTDKISILNWNIYKGQRQKWAEDFLQLSHDVDIVFLQEAPLNSQLQQALNHKNLFWNMNSAFELNGTETGVMVASIARPLGSCGLRNKEPIIRLPKTTLVSSYIFSGSAEILLVANIHSINFSLGIKAYQQQLADLNEILIKHDGPIILAGDFNNWNEERTAILRQFAARLMLQSLTFEEEKRTTYFGAPVDHILYRGLVPVTSTVHPVTSSDHNPISATFRLDGGQNASQPKPL